MRFPAPLIRGRLIQRYKRFLADVLREDGQELTAACPNTGAMLGLTEPGSAIWLSTSDSPSRKYRHTWELVEVGRGRRREFVGINTGLPNRIVAEVVAAGRIDRLGGYETLRREVRYGAASRIDILLEDPSRGRCWIEIKNVHLSRAPGLAEFPDCPTERGVKHLRELSAMTRAGDRAVMVFLIQRLANRFAIASDLDPTYAAAFAAARAVGVEAIALTCRVSPDAIETDSEVPIVAA